MAGVKKDGSTSAESRCNNSKDKDFSTDRSKVKGNVLMIKQPFSVKDVQFKFQLRV